ncbi:TlpA family protein disulfide reductase [Chitinophaga sp. RAB17]|uniref:TlpA family protein disulfide reductase n=1 Tax=Chitinophaga sp. RAB17 TaxID=3233049 RepID=UPI003F93968A
MRYRLILLLACLYMQMASAATKADSSVDVSVSVNGLNMVTISYLDRVNPMSTANMTEGLNLANGNGNWKGRLKIPYTQVIYINNVPVLVHPGDQLLVKMSRRPFNEQLVNCEDAVITGNQSVRLQLLYKLDSLYRFRDSVILSTSFEAYKKILEQKHELAMRLITGARLTGKEDISLTYLYLKMMKMRVKGYYASRYKDENVHAANTPVLFKAWLQEDAEVDHPYLSLIAGDSYVSAYITGCVPGADEGRMAYLMEHLVGDRLKHMVAGNDAVSTLHYNGANEHFTDIYELIQQKVSQPEIRAYYDSLYHAYQPLNLGHPAFDFTLTDLQGKSVRLSDYKGKMVIIDLWATWCATCVAELPNFERIADSLQQDGAIVFVSIAWDEEAVWKSYLDKHPKSSAIKLRLSPDENDKNMQDFVKHYQLTGVPRYLMIDMEGKFLTAFAPLPSDPVYTQLLGMWMKMRK